MSEEKVEKRKNGGYIVSFSQYIMDDNGYGLGDVWVQVFFDSVGNMTSHKVDGHPSLKRYTARMQYKDYWYQTADVLFDEWVKANNIRIDKGCFKCQKKAKLYLHTTKDGRQTMLCAKCKEDVKNPNISKYW